MPPRPTSTDAVRPKKRKRSEPASLSIQEAKKSRHKSSSKAVAEPSAEIETVTREEILGLEQAIADSPKHYNYIVTLLEHLQDSATEPELVVDCVVALCRTFCRLMEKGHLSQRKGIAEPEVTIVVEWLKERYKHFNTELYALLDHEVTAVQHAALTLLMRLIKEEMLHLEPSNQSYYFPHARFEKIVLKILCAEALEESVKEEFVEKYLDEFDDLRYSFFTSATKLASQAPSNPSTLPNFTSTLLTILFSLKNLPTAETGPFESLYALSLPSSSKNSNDKLPAILRLSAHRKAAQECWLATLRLPGLSKDQNKQVLMIMTSHIVPVFVNPQLLMDFLVDSYDAGGSISLLALNGLFYLISTKNLDYPNFYPKLYALLSRYLFHVRYRSRFFRLLDTFLDSTHLPATLIASFIKKMSRLSLFAPPSAIVMVVPFIYNLLKKHPSCTFMVHREGSATERDLWRKEGVIDIFDENESDPMKTRAIDSCLWEIEMLMGHWHPNVATLARIIGEQFTKERYGLEDFLDHSYSSMFDAEAVKNIRKPPVVEFDIPKKIFFPTEVVEEKEAERMDVDAEERPLLKLWNFE